MKKIALYGGTFDPVHLGHLNLVEEARKQVALDRVIFVPCWQSPFKSATVASGEQRYTMLKLAIEERKFEQWAEVSDFEIQRPKPSYSWQTARHYHESDPTTKWHWILGTDQWNQIDQWAEPEILAELLDFIVVTRDGDQVIKRDGWNYTKVTFEHPASASAIREDLSSYTDWLPGAIVDYIDAQNLYTGIS